MKKFIITIDTEGDNLWSWKPGDTIRTDNSNYLERFQVLCDKFGFKPVWLSNYEMLQDARYVDFIKKVVSENRGELGMHLHAWNTPPFYELPIEQNGAPYLVEYPDDIMEEKINEITKLIIGITGKKPVSHRAGRWAMNDKYYDLLMKYGYRVDCSITPHIDWKSSVGQTALGRGSDYTMASELPFWVYHSKVNYRLLEVPVTIRKSHKFFVPEDISVKRMIGNIIRAYKGEALWIRPTGNNLSKMLYLIKQCQRDEGDYLMFMIHSSELMPGGSPTFKNKDMIEKLYQDLERLFIEIAKKYEGITLEEYYQYYIEKE